MCVSLLHTTSELSSIFRETIGQPSSILLRGIVRALRDERLTELRRHILAVLEDDQGLGRRAEHVSRLVYLVRDTGDSGDGMLTVGRATLEEILAVRSFPDRALSRGSNPCRST